MATIYEEITKLGELTHCGWALVQYSVEVGAVSLHAEGRRWVARPTNFVTFTIQSARNKDIVVTLRGEPYEFESLDELNLQRDRPGYSRFNFSKPSQLQAAATHIKRALELFNRGPGRPPKRPRTTEG